MIDNGVDEGAELSGVAEGAVADGVEDTLELGVELEAAVEVVVAEIFDIFGQVAKEEDVIFADFPRDLNICAVACSYNQTTIEHELP